MNYKNMTIITILDISPIIKSEEKEARYKIRKSWHWGNTGSLQKYTVDACIDLIVKNMDDSGVLNISRLIPELEKHEEMLKYDSNDEYGYAHGTARAITNYIKRVVQTRQENPDLSIANYRKLLNKIRIFFLKKKYLTPGD